MGFKDLTGFVVSPDCRVEVASVEGRVLIAIHDDERHEKAAIICPAPTAIDLAVRILQLAGCSVRRVAFGHMLPDQVTVAVPEVEDGEAEELPEAGT